MEKGGVCMNALELTLGTFVALMTGHGSLPASVQAGNEHELPSQAIELSGRWDVTVQGPDGPYPSWFEIEADAGTLRGRFVGKDGSARPIARLEFSDKRLRFSLPHQYEKIPGDVVFQGILEDNRIRGVTFGEKGEELSFVALRAPDLIAEDNPSWGDAIRLFDGIGLSQWQVRYPDVRNGWGVENGILTNAPPSVDIMTLSRFRDFKLHLEFKMPPRCNSGVYLRGRYEVQITQDYGRDPGTRSSGSIYGFIAPRLNATRPPGEWNTLDITLVGRRVTVTYNGELVIEDAEIPGITGGALDSNEGEPGPILLQGDHEAVQYRNIYLIPAR